MASKVINFQKPETLSLLLKKCKFDYNFSLTRTHAQAEHMSATLLLLMTVVPMSLTQFAFHAVLQRKTSISTTERGGMSSTVLADCFLQYMGIR